MSKTESAYKFALANPQWALDELDKADCEESLSEFLRQGWKYVDPNPYIGGWHLDAICEHLEAVADGQIKRLVVNVPPRTSKSSAVSVAFPAWVWAQKQKGYLCGPQVQFLFASYAQSLSFRDSVKTRRLIESPWYQRHWNDRYSLTGDQNTKIRFDNNKGGYRIATSVGGSLTGEGGSIIVVDDVLNANEVASDAVRQTALDWWDTAMSTRLNDPKQGAYIVIMQRLAEDDLTGHILNNNDGEWTHLMLPMRFEPERKCYTDIGWEDPRTIEGELLCPERFGEREVSELERRLGPWGSSGQLQQRPEPKGGGIFKREWWQDWANPDDPDDPRYKAYPPCDYILASLDGAYTEKQENDFSALTIWGVWRENDLPHAILMHGWKDRLQIHELVNRVAASCKKYRVNHLLIEAKASGISVAQEIRRLHAGSGFSVQLIDPKGDKVARAYAIQPLFSDEMIYAPLKRDWADMVVTEMASFPRGAHDDLTDSAAQGLKYLRDVGFLVHGEEVAMEMGDELLYKPQRRALYPV